MAATPELTPARPGLPEGDLRPRVRGRARDDVGAREPDGRQRTVRDGDDEAPGGARARRAGAVPGCDPDRRGPAASPSRCSATTVSSSATSPTGWACRCTRCTPRRTAWSTSSRRSSRRRSTPSSASRRTTRTATRSPTASCGSRSRASAPWPTWGPASGRSVSRVPDGDPDLLRYLTELGLVPGSDVEVVSQAPFAGPVTVLTGSGAHAISRELADRIGAAA